MFKNWIPRTPLQYGLTVLFCLALALVYEALQAWMQILELKWSEELVAAEKQTNNNEVMNKAFMHEAKDKGAKAIKNIGGYMQGKTGFKVALLRGILRTVSITLSYFLMFIAMTFNMGLFIAVVCGFGLGTFLFTPVYKLAHHANLKISADVPGGDCC